jgi:hypothetical protein
LHSATNKLVDDINSDIDSDSELVAPDTEIASSSIASSGDSVSSERKHEPPKMIESLDLLRTSQLPLGLMPPLLSDCEEEEDGDELVDVGGCKSPDNIVYGSGNGSGMSNKVRIGTASSNITPQHHCSSNISNNNNNCLIDNFPTSTISSSSRSSIGGQVPSVTKGPWTKEVLRCIRTTN